MRNRDSGRAVRGWRAWCLAMVLGLAALPVPAQNGAAGSGGGAAVAGEELSRQLLDAREALRKRDRARLAAHRAYFVGINHPLAGWVDYWELSNRLSEATQPELDAFYARWPGSYVEDRLRNDWLLELGKRRDWRNFAAEYPRFRMNDDREVACYALLVRHLNGEDVRRPARDAWLAQRDGDEGCALLAGALVEARRFTEAEIWERARQAAEYGRMRAAKQALALLPDAPPAAIQGELLEQPQKYLAKRPDANGRRAQELLALALVRIAASEPMQAAALLEERAPQLPAETAAWVWSVIGRQGAMKLLPEAEGWFQRADQAGRDRTVAWSDDNLAWRARAALRAPDAGRWSRVLAAIDLMSAAEQRDPTWVYWKARALQATAPAGSDGEPQRLFAQSLLEQIAPQFSFYGKLASEDLGLPQTLPPRPEPLTAEERARAERNPALTRALMLIGIGLRSEGVREWNFALRDLSGDRELLAAAQRACEREVWDRCINTSDRTRQEIDMATRFPTPFRTDVIAAAREVNLDPAYVYGLIRQESRFVMDARSSVGASGLMQVMPATAKWTARKLGLNFTPEQITDRSMNLRLGTGYLKLVLNDMDNSQPMAAAAYNAGPNRPRRWREGPVLEPAAWAENIPFAETRDYVKKVLSNASYYAALIGGQPQVLLKPRLGAPIGPRQPDAQPENRELP